MLARVDGARVLTPGKNFSSALFQREKALSLSTQVEGWVSLLEHFTQATFHASPSAQRLPDVGEGEFSFVKKDPENFCMSAGAEEALKGLPDGRNGYSRGPQLERRFKNPLFGIRC